MLKQGNTYSHKILKLLEKKLTGTASNKELQELQSFMQNDELFAEAFRNTDLTLLKNAQLIAADANERINEIIKPYKPINKHYIYYGISAVIFIFSLIYFWPEKKQTDITSQNNITVTDANKKEPAASNRESIISLENIQKQATTTTEEKVIIPPSQKNEIKPPVENINNKDENVINEETEIKNNKQEEEKEKQKEQEQENKQKLNTENTANQIDYNIYPTAVRVQHIQILSKINAAESENTSRNNDVTNPNLGEPITKKKNNPDYKLDDMPHYTGNDAGFISYLNRRLNGAVILPRNKIPHTVTVRFIVNSKGKIESSEIIGQLIPPALEKEILNAINEAPDWQPGKLSGKKGKLEYMIAFYFGF
jgi:hypothetical protein